MPVYRISDSTNFEYDDEMELYELGLDDHLFFVVKSPDCIRMIVYFVYHLRIRREYELIFDVKLNTPCIMDFLNQLDSGCLYSISDAYKSENYYDLVSLCEMKIPPLDTILGYEDWEHDKLQSELETIKKLTSRLSDNEKEFAKFLLKLT